LGSKGGIATELTVYIVFRFVATQVRPTEEPVQTRAEALGAAGLAD